jgi:hypothetical protein
MSNALIRPLQSAPETPTFRAPPHNFEAEQALLGAILVNNEACDRVSGFLKPEHFFDALHGRIYDHAAKLIWAGKRATPITLKTFFQGDEPVGDLTVPQYLGRLAANATTIINAEDYGRTIYDLAIRRDLIQIGEGMVNTAYDAPIDAPPAVQIEDTEQKLYELAETGKYGSGFEPFTTALTDAIDMAANAYRRDGGLSGLATGFTDLDGKMGGLQPSDLIIVAGRPSMGKTALATNIAYHVAQSYRRDPDSQFDASWRGSEAGLLDLRASATYLRADTLLPLGGLLPQKEVRDRLREIAPTGEWIDTSVTMIRDAVGHPWQLQVKAKFRDVGFAPVGRAPGLRGLSGTIAGSDPFLFIPSPAFTGTDSFAYEIVDGSGQTAIGVDGNADVDDRPPGHPACAGAARARRALRPRHAGRRQGRRRRVVSEEVVAD